MTTQKFRVEKVILLNDFDTMEAAEKWMKQVQKLNDDSEIRFQISEDKPTPSAHRDYLETNGAKV